MRQLDEIADADAARHGGGPWRAARYRHDARVCRHDARNAIIAAAPAWAVCRRRHANACGIRRWSLVNRSPAATRPVLYQDIDPGTWAVLSHIVGAGQSAALGGLMRSCNHPTVSKNLELRGELSNPDI